MNSVGVSLAPGRPLAPMQRPLWMSQRLHPTAPVQNMALLTHIDGSVDIDRLRQAFDVVVGQSDALRTRIVETDGRPRVTLDAAAQHFDAFTVGRAEAEAWAAERAATPIDLSVRGYDGAILVHEDGTVSWYLALHHAITDATSSALVFAATAAAYHGETVQLDEYYRWAATTTEPTERVRRAAEHWRDRPEIAPPDRLYRPVGAPSPAADRIPVQLESDLLAAADAGLDSDYEMISRDLGWTALLMTVTASYLWSLTGSSRLRIGLPVHNRSGQETRELIGPVMEVFPVDIEIEHPITWRALHKRVARALMSTLARAAPGTAPAADHAAVVNVIARAGLGFFGELPTTTTWIHSGAIDSSQLLRVQFTAYDQTLALDVGTEAADGDHRARAAGHFRSIMAAMLADPDGPIGAPALSPAERVRLEAWGRGVDFDDPTVDLVQRLEAQLGRQTSVALRDGHRTITGEELWAEATRVARWLTEHGAQTGTRVAIDIGRSVDAVIAILGTLIAGSSFVPLDPALPAAQRERLAKRANAVVVLTDLPVVARSDGGRSDDGASGEIQAGVGDDSEAYLLFTSGSTGEPKGVPITRHGISRYLHFAVDAYTTADSPPIAPLFSSLGFDLTMTSLFLPLLTGGELVVIEAAGPSALTAIAADRTITWCKATPSHLEILLRLLPPDHRLATLVVGGEAFGSGLGKRLLTDRPDLAIFNEYGPTEAVVGCMIHRVDPERIDANAEVPIGRPAPGVELRIVGPDLEPVPIGVAGELCIASEGLTSGYLTADDEPSTEQPTTDAGPFVVIDGTRFYRSGDVVRLVATDDPNHPDGSHTAIYLGRIDYQVKVGGVRLEPSGVADALAAHPSIEAATVALWSPRPVPPTARCVRCGLADNVPQVSLDTEHVCNSCRDYDRIAPQVAEWFGSVDDLTAIKADASAARTGPYDCVHLLSGGKDSTYALYRLVELGFEPYVFTLDNGFISDQALDNVRRAAADLSVTVEIATSDVMNEIFRVSLDRYSNVCNGCYKTLYTLATNRAVELGAPLVMTGLSRGQLFETRLLPKQFAANRFDPESIDRAVIEARKIYHRIDDGPNRLLDTAIFADDDLFDRVRYVDFYRYEDVELGQLYRYLDERAPWVRPTDTGRSTNCLINAAGIHTHLQEQGYHNYAVPYAWDVRLGHKTRGEAIAELDDELDHDEVDRLLSAVGYEPAPKTTLTAWVTPVAGQRAPSAAEARAFLANTFPPYAIPRAIVEVDALPLTSNGKLDEAALPAPERIHRTATGVAVEAETDLERTVVGLWERVLRTEPIGIDDDFFALGGDSLAALEMSVVLSETLGYLLPDDLAFINTTPRELASAIEALTGAERGATEEPATREDAAKRLALDGPGPARDWTTEPDGPPLSAGEQAILYEQAARPTAVMYNVGRLYVVDGATKLDVARFVEAVMEVVANQGPLTWTYGPTRRRLDPADAVLIDHDPYPIERAELDALARRAHRSPIDLADGPLLRVLIRELVDETTAVLFVCHHVSADAESFDRLWPQIDSAYRGDPRPAPPIDYPTFTQWQSTRDSTAADRRYWLDRALDEHDEPASLSTYRPASGVAHDGWTTRTASVTTQQLVSRPGASPFALAIAAIAATVSRYGDSDRVALGMVTSTRESAYADHLVGYFLNTLPIELGCDHDDTLDDIVARARDNVAGNLAHRSYPYGQIVADRREAGLAAPSAKLLAVYERLPAVTLDGASVEQSVLSPGDAVADATFFVTECGDRIELGLESNGEVIGIDVAHQLLGDIDAMLAAIVMAPTNTVGEVILPSADASVLIGPPLNVVPSTLMDRIEGLLASSQGQAVDCGDVTISWPQLGGRVGQLAEQLAAAGIGRGDRVIVHLERGPDLIAAILAILRRGAAYVPIDRRYPADRVRLLVAESEAAAAFVELDDERSLTPNDLVPAEAEQAREPNASIAFDPPNADDLAYLIFTSGSTGRPRGVGVTHGQLAASTAARDVAYDESPKRFAMVSSPAFDSSIVGLFWTLSTGGTVVLPTDSEVADPDALISIFERRDVSHTLLVPSLYGALLERGANAKAWPRHVIVAGEACPWSLVTSHFVRRPLTALTNEYGPTEATVWSTLHHLAPDMDPVPIGGPIPGAWATVVDTEDRPRPPGVPGELVVGGAGIVDGYLNDAEATSSRFGRWSNGRFFRTGDRAVIVDGLIHYLGRVDDQLNVGGVRAEPGDIEAVLLAPESVGAAIVTAQDSRSLDELVAATPAAELGQAMGQAAPTDDPATSLAAALRRPDGPHARLIAHLEPAQTPSGRRATIDLDAVRRLATDRLPPTMRPTGYSIHGELPRTANGKLDRAAALALPPPTSNRRPVIDASVSDAQPRSDVLASERADRHLDDVRSLFASTLGINRIGQDESFFDLGGHSLLALDLLHAIERRFDTDITVASLHEKPTPAGIAALIETMAPAGPEATPTASATMPQQNRFLVPIQPEGSAPPLFAVHVLGINCGFFRPLAAVLGNDQPMFGLGQPSPELDTTTPSDVGEIASLYADELQRCAPKGPISLIAVSLGAVVAYELAQQLRARGRTVGLVAFLDAAGPGAAAHAPSLAEKATLHASKLRSEPIEHATHIAERVRQHIGRRREIAVARLRTKLGVSATGTDHVRRFIEANWESQMNYVPEPYRGAVTVFKAADDPFNQRLAAAGMGWREVIDGPLDIIAAPGGHLSMLAEPNVAHLGQLLATALGKALPPATPLADVERALIDGLGDATIGTVVARLLDDNTPMTDAASALVAAVDETTRAIAGDAAVKGAEAVEALAAVGVDASLEPSPIRMPYPIARLRLTSGTSVEAATTVLGQLGYRSQHNHRSAAVTAGVETLIRPDASTTRLDLVLGDEAIEDREASDPSRRCDTLGVFLGTPASLLGDLIRLAEPTGDELLVDLGCGDGRVLVEAVRSTGCQARGIENDTELVAIARQRVAEADLDDRIEIVEGDATVDLSSALSGASIVFLFLPAETTTELVPAILERLPAGGRLVAHEQARIAGPVVPDSKTLLVGDALTVACCWTR